jgi:hypothetical protein
MWLQHFLIDLGIQFHWSIVIWCYNQSTLKLCRDPDQRQWKNHIKIHMHYIWNLVHEGIIDLQFCPSAEQTADIFTKTFTEQKFHSLRSHLGVKDTVSSHQSTLKLCRDPDQRQWKNHIKIHMHYIWNLVHEGIIDLQFCPSAEQTADIFTKTFTEQKFHSLRSHLGVKDTVS